MMHSILMNNIMRYVLWLVALIVACIPLLMIYELMLNGATHLSLAFILDEPLRSGREGGIFPLLVSTTLILLVCMVVVVPLGLLCALFLNERIEKDSRLGYYLNQALDILSAVPSIVYGLFGYVFFTEILGLGFSILSGGLSLACMVLPLFVRMAELALSYSPVTYRQAAYALHISHIGFIRKVLLPSAANGIAFAAIIAMGRALAETAVLIFTAGYVMRMPGSLLDSGRALSVHIYDLAMNVPGGTHAAAATALVLISLLIIINILAKKLGNYWVAI